MDPDPPISEPEMGGGGSLKNIFFQPFGPQFGPKFKGGLGPPGSSPESITVGGTVRGMVFM